MMRAFSTLCMLGVVGGCSSFNMVAECSKTGIGLMRTLVVGAGEHPDDARLASIMTVGTPREVAAEYNGRTCQTDVTAFGRTLSVTYKVRQSEGVKDWFEVELPSDPSLELLRGELRSAYVA